MSGRHCERMRVTYYDLDCTSSLKRASFMRMANIAGDNHAASLGIGTSKLYERTQAFLLSRFSWRFFKEPVYNQIVDIYTWSVGVAGATFLRNGEMLSEGGEKLVEWASRWVLVDTQTHSLLRPSALDTSVPHDGVQGVTLTTDRIVYPDGPADYTHSHVVRYSDMDPNIHMNNVVYMDIIMDSLPLEALDNRLFRTFHISYIKEAAYGEQIDISCKRDRDIFWFKGSVGGGNCFLAKGIL